MVELAKQHGDDCMLVRYEDLMAAPLDHIPRIYEFLGLAFSREQEFRMATREFIGREKTQLAGREVQAGKDWLSQQELIANFVQPDVNSRARARLSATDSKEFLRIAGPVMEELRYV
jgi:hypothetical protein